MLPYLIRFGGVLVGWGMGIVIFIALLPVCLKLYRRKSKCADKLAVVDQPVAIVEPAVVDAPAAPCPGARYQGIKDCLNQFAGRVLTVGCSAGLRVLQLFCRKHAQVAQEVKDLKEDVKDILIDAATELVCPPSTPIVAKDDLPIVDNAATPANLTKKTVTFEATRLVARGAEESVETLPAIVPPSVPASVPARIPAPAVMNTAAPANPFDGGEQVTEESKRNAMILFLRTQQLQKQQQQMQPELVPAPVQEVSLARGSDYLKPYVAEFRPEVAVAPQEEVYVQPVAKPVRMTMWERFIKQY